MRFKDPNKPVQRTDVKRQVQYADVVQHGYNVIIYSSPVYVIVNFYT